MNSREQHAHTPSAAPGWSLVAPRWQPGCDGPVAGATARLLLSACPPPPVDANPSSLRPSPHPAGARRAPPPRTPSTAAARLPTPTAASVRLREPGADGGVCLLLCAPSVAQHACALERFPASTQPANKRPVLPAHRQLALVSCGQALCSSVVCSPAALYLLASSALRFPAHSTCKQTRTAALGLRTTSRPAAW